ncbi:MAG: hypothetical protein CMM93_05565 [Rickettsiales bacterium]|nr:hypothetical protein [Rickettsiales bacterium]|tara:strand:- start:882 stop:1868 length:987 start_codon:yes stop_codon:yes gene_type:complete
MRMQDEAEERLDRDFIPRSYMQPFYYMLPVVGVCALLTLLAAMFGWTLSTHPFAVTLFLLSLIATLAMIGYSVKRNQDHAVEQEFQNLLFASAMASRCEFCLFVKRDGSIVYANPDACDIFPDLEENRSFELDELLTRSGVDEAIIERLYQGLNQNKHSAGLLEFGGDEGERFIVELQPLTRPYGYSVVQGREFVEKRSREGGDITALQHADAALLQAMVSQWPFGMYLTSPTGVITYSNPMLNQWLRYDTTSLAAEHVTVQRMVYHADGYETLEFDVGNYSGAVMLSCANSSLRQAELEQFPLYNAERHLLGYAGLVQLTAQSEETA